MSYFDDAGVCRAHQAPGCTLCGHAADLDELGIPVDQDLELELVGAIDPAGELELRLEQLAVLEALTAARRPGGLG